MTREEIEELKGLATSMGLYDDKNPCKRAVILGKAIKALEQESRWIPVSERLPTKEEYIANNGLFIVSDGNRTYTEYFDVYSSKYFGEPTMNGFREDRCVIAWMPLPKAYREVVEE